MTLFDQVGGHAFLLKIVKRFYDKVYSDPWLKLYFEQVPQSHIENQQLDFMTQALGGPRKYMGKNPTEAHKHIFITPELYELRRRLLNEALSEENAPRELIERWNKIEEAFRDSLIKENLKDCEPRFKTDSILNFDDPKLRGKKKRVKEGSTPLSKAIGEALQVPHAKL